MLQIWYRSDNNIINLRHLLYAGKYIYDYTDWKKICASLTRYISLYQTQAFLLMWVAGGLATISWQKCMGSAGATTGSPTHFIPLPSLPLSSPRVCIFSTRTINTHIKITDPQCPSLSSWNWIIGHLTHLAVQYFDLLDLPKMLILL